MAKEIDPLNVTELHFFDFDGTLIDSPTPDEGRLRYEAAVGSPYPHTGWWGRLESLHEAMDIMAHIEVVNVAQSLTETHQYRVLLTNRQPKLTKEVTRLLSQHGIELEELSFKRDCSKCDRIRDFLVKFPNVKRIVCYDDMDDQLAPFAGLVKELSTKEVAMEVYRVRDGKIQLYEPEKKVPAYCGVILTEDSHAELVNLLGRCTPQGWEVIAHHMTTQLGALPEALRPRIGETVQLEADAFGCYEEKAMAVRIKPGAFPTRSETPHVTLAVNRSEGGKPYDSNKITEWVELDSPLIIEGIVGEVFN